MAPLNRVLLALLMLPREARLHSAQGVSSPPQMRSCSSITATTTNASGLARQSATALDAAFMNSAFLSPMATLV